MKTQLSLWIDAEIKTKAQLKLNNLSAFVENILNKTVNDNPEAPKPEETEAITMLKIKIIEVEIELKKANEQILRLKAEKEKGDRIVRTI